MALCNLCRDVPFGSLPAPHREHEYTFLIANNHQLVQLRKDRTHNDTFQADSLGHPWHESLEALAEASKSDCPLCQIVQEGVQRWIDNYESEEKTNATWLEFRRRNESIPHGQRLWLCNRFGRGDGFDVLVRQPAAENILSFITSVAFVAAASSPLADKFPLRPLEPDSSSKESLEVAASWLRTCVKTHKDCPIEETMLPSRVLDVGSSEDTIRLITHTTGLVGKYVTLSYRWGNSNTVTTTEESIEARSSGIAISSLPKTFRDAVAVTRYLGLRYLWIDSLCILQNQRSDWVRESAAMNKIYSEAYLTIAASHNQDCSDGCFNHREPFSSVDFTMPDVGEVRAQLLRNKDQRMYDRWDFWDEPLSKRGWSMQERVLSRRILFYNTEQMYFECSDGITGEDGAHSDHRDIDLYDIRSNIKSLDRDLSSRTLWYRLVRSYGGRELTKATDKLPAVSGLAKLLGKQRDDRYVAGLWSSSLIEGLSWQSLGDQMSMSTSEFIAPSWSWASFRGVAATGVQDDWHDIAKILGWHVELKDVESPYGEISDGWIRVHGPLAKLTPSKVAVTAYERRLHRAELSPLPRFRTKYSEDEEGALVFFDRTDDPNSGNWRSRDVHVLILGGYSSELDQKQQQEDQDDAPKMEEDNKQYGTKDADAATLIYGLVVAPSGSAQDNSMERLGWMFLKGSEAIRFVNDEACWKPVKLV